MTTLYFIRHAEAEGNLYRRIHGQYDSLVTVNGYRQLAALQQRFADIHLDAAYSSDLFRSKTTAKAVCDPKGLPVTLRADLRELHMGEWEDKTWGETGLEDRARMQLFTQSSPAWQVAGSETFGSLQERVYTAVMDIAALHPNQTVAIFSHGTAIRYVCAKLLGLSLEESRTVGHSDNTAVTLVELESGKANFILRDDNSHLTEKTSTLAQQGWWRRKEGTDPDENLWYQPMPFSQMTSRDLYLASRKEAWSELGRDLSYLEAQDYLPKAMAVAEENPQFVTVAKRSDTTVGILQLNPALDAEEGAGHIAFYYMLPAFRGGGLGVQLIGQAISIYRPMGRTKLRLVCGEDNQSAMHFYKKHGFEVIGTRTEPFATLHTLEKYIGY